jgi:hypothetical protein
MSNPLQDIPPASDRGQECPCNDNSDATKNWGLALPAFAGDTIASYLVRREPERLLLGNFFSRMITALPCLLVGQDVIAARRSHLVSCITCFNIYYTLI